jgi:regulator of sigma E protease
MRQICEANTVTVVRNGSETEIAIPEDLGLLDMNKGFIGFRTLPIVGAVDSVTVAAANAGIRTNDRIVSIDGKEIYSWSDITPVLENLKAEGKATFDVEVMRDSLVHLTATVDTTYRLGIIPVGNDYTPEHISYSFFASFPAGIAYGMDVLKGYVSDFKYVFSSEGAKSVGMFGSIGSLFPATWDWHAFWMMTAFLSIVLAFMNILPIPALDGGRLVFIIYEMIFKKPVPPKKEALVHTVGIIILFAFMILITFKDIWKLIVG